MHANRGLVVQGSLVSLRASHASSSLTPCLPSPFAHSSLSLSSPLLPSCFCLRTVKVASLEEQLLKQEENLKSGSQLSEAERQALDGQVSGLQQQLDASRAAAEEAAAQLQELQRRFGEETAALHQQLQLQDERASQASAAAGELLCMHAFIHPSIHPSPFPMHAPLQSHTYHPLPSIPSLSQRPRRRPPPPPGSPAARW